MAATAALVLLPALPAAATTLAACTVDKPLTIRPGFLLFPATFQSEEGGTVLCEGIIQDRLLLGPGDLSFRGIIGLTAAQACAAGPDAPLPIPPEFDGAGILELTARTLPFGSVTVNGAFAYARSLGFEVSVLGAMSDGSTLTGALVFTTDSSAARSAEACEGIQAVSARVTGELALVGP